MTEELNARSLRPRKRSANTIDGENRLLSYFPYRAEQPDR
jgi:hypothetical protein